MAVLRPDRRSALSALLKTVLSATFEDALAETNRATISASSVCAAAAMDAVLAVVHTELSDFAEACNLAQSDPLVALPPEIISDIFLELEFSELIVASHVCKSWRAATLDNPSLWAEYYIPTIDDDASDASDPDSEFDPEWDGDGTTTTATAAMVLSALLERSFPVPFRLRCDDDVPDAIAEIVIENMDRIEVLCVQGFKMPGTFARLFATDAPVLRSFSCCAPESADISPALPCRWAGASAPFLERLNVFGHWDWPAGSVCSTLRVLERTLPKVSGVNWRLADLFPNMESLDVSVTQASIDHLDPLPRRLTALRLCVEKTGALDCVRMLRHCEAYGLHMLTLSGRLTLSSVDDAIALFFRLYRGEWALHVDIYVEFSSVQTTAAYKYTLDPDAGWLSRVPGTLSSWHRLHKLDISLDDILKLWDVLLPGAVLPALSILRVSVLDIDSTVQRARELENGVHIDAPALGSVSIRIQYLDMRKYSLVSQEYPPSSGTELVLPILRAFRAPPLESIVVHTNAHGTFSQGEVCQLAGIAERLLLHEGDPLLPPIVFELGRGDA